MSKSYLTLVPLCKRDQEYYLTVNTFDSPETVREILALPLEWARSDECVKSVAVMIGEGDDLLGLTVVRIVFEPQTTLKTRLRVIEELVSEANEIVRPLHEAVARHPAGNRLTARA